MKNYTLLLVAFFAITTLKAQQCCNVVDGNGVSVITPYNGLCVIAPNLPGANFCPKDADGDGINDDVDKCPDIAGVAEFEGCIPPDTDGDGVIDSKDECPEVAGTINGCPDSDEDGIIDSKDKCPKVKGTTIEGCPDSDGDGIIDADDPCPNVAGSPSGCPDTDGDGVPDNKDSCPNEVGIASNKGCPELAEAEKQILKEALEGVNFLSGKDVLTEESKPKLHDVTTILNAHKGYKIKVSGYTDSSGKEESNLLLSKKRAAAVKAYLIEDGISESRIFDEGFGEADPVADNSTAAGRAKNRRVEFEIVY